MPLQRVARRAAAALFRDSSLLCALRSELNYELTASSQIHQEVILPSDFSVHYDSPNSQDIFLKRQNIESNEEISVSALLAPLRFIQEESFHRKVLMKVSVKKPDFESVIRFDCSVFRRGESSDFRVKDSCYHFDSKDLGMGKKYLGPKLRVSGARVDLEEQKYLVPKFSPLDPKLQEACKYYLNSRGINTGLTDFLLNHLINKEQGQYVNWLRSLEAAFAMDS